MAVGFQPTLITWIGIALMRKIHAEALTTVDYIIMILRVMVITFVMTAARLT